MAAGEVLDVDGGDRVLLDLFDLGGKRDFFVLFQKLEIVGASVGFLVFLFFD